MQKFVKAIKKWLDLNKKNNDLNREIQVLKRQLEISETIHNLLCEDNGELKKFKDIVPHLATIGTRHPQFMEALEAYRKELLNQLKKEAALTSSSKRYGIGGQIKAIELIMSNIYNSTQIYGTKD